MGEGGSHSPTLLCILATSAEEVPEKQQPTVADRKTTPKKITVAKQGPT